MEPAPAGERYNEVNGYYFERRRATIPATIGTRALRAGDIVNVVVKAGGLQQEFRYRIEATADPVAAGQTAKKRVLVVAAEDYTGKSPNVDAGYATAPRYLAQHVAALEAAGYEVETFNIDAPPANGGTPNGVSYPPIKYPTALGVLSHFDAVNYYSGDDFVPQDVSETNPRRLSSATGADRLVRDGALGAQGHDRAARVRQRGRQAARRRPQRAPGLHRQQREPRRDRAVHLDAGQAVRLLYPPNNAGDDDLPGTAWQRSRESSNDTWQNYLGVVGRQSGIGTNELEVLTVPGNNGQQVANPNPLVSPYPVAPKADGILAGMAPLTIDTGSAGDPNQAADGSALPQARKPLRLRNWGPTNEPLRAERVDGDFATPLTYTTSGGAVISTRDSVALGFGLEQLSQAQRNEVVQACHDAPAADDGRHHAADDQRVQVPGRQLPSATPNDPVELELTTFDERGDMDKVDLYADGVYYATTEVYPFQFRYSAAGLRRRQDRPADRQGVRRGGQRGHVRHAVRQRRRGGRRGRIAAADRRPDARRLADRRPDAHLRQWRLPERPRVVQLRVAAQRRGDRRGHRRRPTSRPRATSVARSPAACPRPTARARPTPRPRRSSSRPRQPTVQAAPTPAAAGREVHGQGGVQAGVLAQGHHVHDHASDAEGLHDDAERHGARAEHEEDLPQVEQHGLREDHGPLDQAPEEGHEGGHLRQERLHDQELHGQGQLVLAH